MKEYKGEFTKIDDHIDNIDRSSEHPSLLKSYMVTNDSEHIRFYEITPQNIISVYIEDHPEDFIKILRAMDYKYIDEIYGQVANPDNVLKYYSFEHAFRKYIDWIEEQEKNIKAIWNKGSELIEHPKKWHCGHCSELVKYDVVKYMYSDETIKCPYCGNTIYTKSQYRNKYGFNFEQLLNYNKFETVSTEMEF